jgi:hypothetical protein
VIVVPNNGICYKQYKHGYTLDTYSDCQCEAAE